MAVIVFFFSFHFTQQGLLILIQVTPQKPSYLIFFFNEDYIPEVAATLYMYLSEYNVRNRHPVS